jgi:hypothetical protein
LEIEGEMLKMLGAQIRRLMVECKVVDGRREVEIEGERVEVEGE